MRQHLGNYLLKLLHNAPRHSDIIDLRFYIWNMPCSADIRNQAHTRVANPISETLLFSLHLSIKEIMPNSKDKLRNKHGY